MMTQMCSAWKNKVGANQNCFPLFQREKLDAVDEFCVLHLLFKDMQ